MVDQQPKDIPRADAVARAEKLIRPGCDVYFKFTCEKCGERCTLSEPNKIYPRGECCKCGHEMPLEMIGFAVIFTTRVGK